MTLEELSYIGQAVAAVAVVLSLAAVYGQVRQTNKIARAELTHSVWLQAGQMHASLYDTPEKAELMHRALFETGPLSDAEKLRLDIVIGMALGVHEAAFNIRQRGLIEIGAYNGLEMATRRYLRSSFVQLFWARRRNDGNDPAYVALLDGMVAQINERPPARASGASVQ
ncbi:MAG: hypothetical protein ACKVS5_04430 [Parvularculaceae bacterium]